MAKRKPPAGDAPKPRATLFTAAVEIDGSPWFASAIQADNGLFLTPRFGAARVFETREGAWAWLERHKLTERGQVIDHS